MGHVGSVNDTDFCTTACTFNGSRPRVAVSIRNPYDYYASLYKMAYAGKAVIHARLPFEKFMETYVARQPPPRDSLRGAHDEHTLTQTLAAACGSPCRHDYLLRTESLAADRAALVRDSGLPVAPTLPVFNVATRKGVPSVIAFTSRVLEIVDRADGRLFDTFGYSRRTVPFNHS